MTTLRVQAPPVNLKERIAALQQRSVSPGPGPTSPSPGPAPPSSAGLRDKIARFEKKGGIPVPRGSFGLGAPPLAENGPARRRGELYGNRIPGAVRASGGGPPISRSVSPFENSRSFSMSALDADELDTSASDGPSSPASPVSPYLGPSVEHSSAPRPAPRGTAFATALDIARRAESSGETSFGRLDAREASATPPPASRTPMLILEPLEPELLIGDDLELELQESPPAIIISSDEHPHTPELESFEDDSAAAATTLPTPRPLDPVPSPPSPNPSTIPASGGVEQVSLDIDRSGPERSPVDAEALLTLVSEPAIPSTQASAMIEDTPVAPVPTEETVSNQPSVAQGTKKPLPQMPLPSPDAMPAAISSENPPTKVDSNKENYTEGAAISESAPAGANLPASSDNVTPIVETVIHSEIAPSPFVAPPQEIEEPEHDTIFQKKARPEVQEIEILSPDIQSPVGPLTLADAVVRLGETVANIRDLFPDQISPLATPPAYRSLHIESATDDGIRTHRREESISREHRKKPSVDLKITVETPPDATNSVPMVETASKPEEHPQPEVLLPTNNKSSITTTESTPQASDHPAAPETLPLQSAVPTTSTPSSDQHAFLMTPVGGRPMSMIETSPSHVVQAHRITPVTSRGVPIFVPAVRGSQDFGHFPPTPDQEETDFGTVSMHKPSHSFSHARTYVSHGQNGQLSQDMKIASFKAVVHTKVTELPPSVSTPVIPQTPQMNRTKRSLYGEVPQSPGYGELASLLQEAALLEETLEKGELPSEALRREAITKQKLGEKVTAERKAVEEKRRVEAAPKSQVKRDEPESKSKPFFRSASLRSRSSSRSNETPTLSSRDYARAKSVLLPHRPVQGSRHPSSSQQSLQPQKLETHDEVPPTESNSNQTSPKSPRQYFAGLRRLASTSRPSISSSAHPRHSASTSSEISSEDSVSVVTPPDGSFNSTASGSGHGHDHVISWPSLSPKKSPGGSPSRAASFAGKLWQRARTKSTISANSAYETIDRITQSAAAKSAAASIPHLEPISFIDVPIVTQTDPPSPIEDLVSPRRSASLHVSSTSQFPPIYSPMPTSPVYTPFTAPVSRADNVFQPFQMEGLLPEPKSDNRPTSWTSVTSTSSTIPSPLFDAFPAVPQNAPLPRDLGFSHTHARKSSRPSLPLPSFFDATPLSSTPVGSEFVSNPSPFLRSATISTSRPATMPPQSAAEHYR